MHSQITLASCASLKMQVAAPCYVALALQGFLQSVSECIRNEEEVHPLLLLLSLLLRKPVLKQAANQLFGIS